MQRQRRTEDRGQHGFTLVEMAVVLFIVGLLIAGLLGPLDVQLEARDRRQTIDTMNGILDALYGFAITHGRLPCPDTDGDGLANPPFDAADVTTATCVASTGSGFADGEGFVPWAEVGTAAGDAWGNRFRYRVTFPAFTLPESDGFCAGNDFDLCAKGTIKILTRGDNPATTGVQEGKKLLTLAATVPAVIISHGRNGFGATAVAGQPRPSPAGGSDEASNADGFSEFVSRGYSRGASGCADNEDESVPLCEFDDIVMWLSPAVLSNRMVQAGRLP